MDSVRSAFCRGTVGMALVLLTYLQLKGTFKQITQMAAECTQSNRQVFSQTDTAQRDLMWEVGSKTR